MKKLFKCFLLAAAAFTLFAGCSGLNGDATVDAEGYDGICNLTISVNGTGNHRSVARTINPDVSFQDDDSLITSYVLKGKSSTGAELGTDGAGFVLGSTDAPDAGSTDADGNTQYKVEIPYGIWELRLEASDGTNLLLQGKSFVDVRTSRAEVPFTLTTDGVSTPGSVTLSGTYTDDQGIAKSYKAGLYDLITGELKYPATETTAATTDAKTFSFTTVPTTGAAKNVAPGRYSFQIRFYNKAVADQASAKIVGYWEDIVVVAPGRSTTDTAINCGKIDQRPAAPTNLRAYRKAGSEDADGYTVVLTWSDNSKNEENFVVTIKEYESESDTTGSVYKVLGVGNSVEGVASNKIEVFYGNAMNAGGSLFTSSTTASIKLPYGKIFDFGIQAENFVGLSDYDTTNNTPSVTLDPSPRNGAATVGADETAAPGSATDYPFYAVANKINRFVINYYLDDGELTLAGETRVRTGNYIEYASIYDYADAAAKKLVNTVEAPSSVLLAINNNDATTAHLSKEGKPFVKWVKMSGTAFVAADVITFEGIDVKADYDTSSLISYEIKDQYRTISASITYDSTDVTAAGKINAKDNKDLIIAASVTPTTDTIDWIKVTINGGSKGKTNSGTVQAATWTYNKVNKLDSGEYTVSVVAHISGEAQSKVYEMSIPLTIER